jgi:Protein of unknown function (DUF3014)
MDDTATQNSQARRIAIALVAALALASGAWWYWHQPATAKAVASPPAPVAGTAAAPKSTPDAVRHPLTPATAPATAQDTAAPAAADPDAAARDGLAMLFGEPALEQWLIPEQLLRRLVATTDNLARNARIEPLRPLRAPATPFAVQREVLDSTTGTERITLSSQNFSRYDAVVALLARTDMAAAAQLYRQLYPSLQKSYEDLGYPDRYFNDRVIDIIDHLLATPEPTAPLLLEQPKVMFRYADVELESRSAGQKLMLRMGVDHARTIKQKLREIRTQIATKE